MNYKQRSKSFNFDFSQNNSFPSPAVNVNLANLSRHSMFLKGLILMELKRIIFLLSSDKSVVNSIKPVLLSEIPMTIFFLLLHEKCFLRIWSHLLKKSLMENFIFCAVFYKLLSVLHFWFFAIGSFHLTYILFLVVPFLKKYPVWSYCHRARMLNLDRVYLSQFTIFIIHIVCVH